MAIPVKQEPDDFKDHFWGAMESCYFCGQSTIFWHENTNNPVCPRCAKIHLVKELPDHGKAIRARKRKARRNQK